MAAMRIDESVIRNLIVSVELGIEDERAWFGFGFGFALGERGGAGETAAAGADYLDDCADCRRIWSFRLRIVISSKGKTD